LGKRTVLVLPNPHNFLGYLYFKKKWYARAVTALNNALAIAQENCYAHFYLRLAYAGMYADASKVDPLRKAYKNCFDDQVAKTRSFADQYPLRVAWLNRWLKN